MTRAIVINDVSVTGRLDDSKRIEYTVTTDSASSKLWYEVDEQYSEYLSHDRCDAAVVALLPLALRSGYELISSGIPISEDLKYVIEKHIVPQLVVSDEGVYKPIKLDVPTVPPIVSGEAVGAGMSMGIDSFTTLWEYGKDCERKTDRITHFTYFNVGAHHGTDRIVGRSQYTSRQLYEGHLEKARSFANEVGYPLVAVDSNLMRFLRDHFGRNLFFQTHTWRNMSAVFALQGLFRRYYYSSAYNIDYFRPSLLGDVAAYEKWLLPTISTPTTQFLSSNENWSRFQKTERVSEMPEAWDHLLVCHVGIDNCGECDKCRKTLMTLDVLGEDVLDRFRNSFDLVRWKSETRLKAFSEIYRQMRRSGAYGVDMRQIFERGVSSGFAYVPHPKPEKRYLEGTVGITSGSCAVQRLPFDGSPAIAEVPAGEPLWCSERLNGWTHVSTDAVDGWTCSSNVSVRKQKPFPEGSTAKARNEVAMRLVSQRDDDPEDPTIHAGDVLLLIRETRGWVYVEASHNRSGYVRQELLAIPSHAGS